jgi:hypothetical protein
MNRNVAVWPPQTPPALSALLSQGWINSENQNLMGRAFGGDRITTKVVTMAWSMEVHSIKNNPDQCLLLWTNFSLLYCWVLSLLTVIFPLDLFMCSVNSHSDPVSKSTSFSSYWIVVLWSTIYWFYNLILREQSYCPIYKLLEILHSCLQIPSLIKTRENISHT